MIVLSSSGEIVPSARPWPMAANTIVGEGSSYIALGSDRQCLNMARNFSGCRPSTSNASLNDLPRSAGGR